MHNIAVTNSPEEKQDQRKDILRCVKQALIQLCGMVNCWWLDDTIDADGPLLTEKCLQKFACTRLRIFSPNLKSSVVSRLTHIEQPAVYTGRGCACVFNDRHQEQIRQLGGLDVVMLDGFGGWTNNVEPLLGQMIRLRLFRQTSGASMMIVFSDLDARLQHGQTVTEAALDVAMRLPSLFVSDESVYSMIPKGHKSYGRSMRVIRIDIQTRTWVDRSIVKPNEKIKKSKQTRMQSRTCSLCLICSLENDMTKLCLWRYNILKEISHTVKSRNGWAHKTCIEMIGLLKAPKNQYDAARFLEAFSERLRVNILDIVRNANGNLKNQEFQVALNIAMDIVTKKMNIKKMTPWARKKMQALVASIMESELGIVDRPPVDESMNINEK